VALIFGKSSMKRVVTAKSNQNQLFLITTPSAQPSGY
jgi:hypothetical protein